PRAEPAVSDVAPPLQPVSRRSHIVSYVLFLGGLLLTRIPTGTFGDSPRYAIGPEPARAASAGFLGAQGLHPAAFRNVTYPAAHWRGDDRLAGKYFLERLPAAAASALFERN